MASATGGWVSRSITLLAGSSESVSADLTAAGEAWCRVFEQVFADGGVRLPGAGIGPTGVDEVRVSAVYPDVALQRDIGDVRPDFVAACADPGVPPQPVGPGEEGRCPDSQEE